MDFVIGELNRSEVLRLQPEQKLIRARYKAKIRQKKRYYSDLENSRKEARKKAKQYREAPDSCEKIKARKRANGAGLSPADIQEILSRQGGVCAICGGENPTDLDHCHETGKVRWLLCKHCNRGLGAFKDDPSLLRKAAEMLEQKARSSK